MPLPRRKIHISEIYFGSKVTPKSVPLGRAVAVKLHSGELGIFTRSREPRSGGGNLEVTHAKRNLAWEHELHGTPRQEIVTFEHLKKAFHIQIKKK